MKVSEDGYELPEAVADTPSELAKIIGVKPNNISSAISKAKSRGYKCMYQKVVVEDE